MSQDVSFSFIHKQKQLDACIDGILKQNSGFVALDTEFIRQETYWPNLALIQISFQEQIFLIDPLTENLDLKTLLPLFNSSEFIKVFHCARQDLEIFWRELGQLPTPLLDTQIAFTYLKGIAGVGYNHLVEHYLGVTLDKTSQHTNWLQRPLNSNQCGYAALDVYYLEKIAPLMHNALEETNRLSYVYEDSHILTNPHHFSPKPSQAWKRVKNTCRSWKELWLFQDITTWREEKALNYNRIRSHILRDTAVNYLCQVSTMHVEDLRSFFDKNTSDCVSGDFESLAKVYYDSIKHQQSQTPEAEKRAEQVKEDLHGKRYTQDELNKMKLMQKNAENLAQNLGVPKNYVASAADIKNFIENPKDQTNKIAHGWRHAALFLES